jgi:hypothetical protein
MCCGSELRVYTWHVKSYIVSRHKKQLPYRNRAGLVVPSEPILLISIGEHRSNVL